MYFPKLTILENQPPFNPYIVKKLDVWLANLPKMHYKYLNPLDFVHEVNINEELGLRLFSECTSNEIFSRKGYKPLLKVKYIVDCPDCNQNVSTYFSKEDLPHTEIKCDEEECDNFIPILHPEKIKIYFELLDNPLIQDKGELEIYGKKSSSPVTLDLYNKIWESQERKLDE